MNKDEKDQLLAQMRGRQKGSGKNKRSAHDAALDVAAPAYQIADHYAYTCGCGSVHFHILKSGKMECSGFGKREDLCAMKF